MHQYHYDIIFLGESFASRIAAVLLAKSGQRVLTFYREGSPDRPWLFTSQHLERILEQLGGRPCLTAPRRLQVITESNRLELHGRHSLADELRREFPHHHASLLALLTRLEELGKRLELQVLDHGGIPLIGLGNRLRWRVKRLLQRPGHGELQRPLSRCFEDFDEAPHHCLTALFSGLAMAPIAELTLAEGALLWHGACQPHGISWSALHDLLDLRYDQFHGLREPLANIRKIDIDRRIHLGDGRFCSANLLIIGHPEALTPSIGPHFPICRRPTEPWKWQSAPLRPKPSKVLAEQIIHGRDPTLRTELIAKANNLICLTEAPATSDPPEAMAATIHHQLTRLLPFTELTQGSMAPTARFETERRRAAPFLMGLPGTRQGPALGKNLLLCHGPSILPHLGATGEVMIGFSLAETLSRKHKS